MRGARSTVGHGHRPPRRTGGVAAIAFGMLVCAAVVAISTNAKVLRDVLAVSPLASAVAAEIDPPAAAEPAAREAIDLAAHDPRVFLLDRDAAELGALVDHDRVIAAREVSAHFTEGVPTRALVVGRSTLERVLRPTAGHDGPDGSDEYNALLAALWNQHVLVGVDVDVHAIGQALGLLGVPAPFDPYGRHLIAAPAESGPDRMLPPLGGVVLQFTLEGGWAKRTLYGSHAALNAMVAETTRP